MSRFIISASFSLLALGLIVGCGGTRQTTITPPASSAVVESAPKWFLSPPQDPNFLFATGTATSRDMQLARDKASDAARMDMAKAIETHFSGLSKRFQEEVGTTADAQYLDQFTQATKSVVSQVLTGVSIDQSTMTAEGGIFRAYVLLKMSLAASDQSLLNKIKQQEQLYTRFRSTQVFDELQKEVDGVNKVETGK
jgi:hypothetical protein